MTTFHRDADGNVFFEPHMTPECTLEFYKDFAETYDEVKLIWHS